MKDLMKENYKVEDMIVKNSNFRKVYNGHDYNIREELVSDLERNYTDEEKLNIIDSWTDGLGTYLLDLIDKYLIIKDNKEVIKQTTWGTHNQTSLKAWFRKNDPRKVIYITWNSGVPTYHLFDTSYRMSKETPRTDYSYKMLYDNEPVVRQWFHGLLNHLLQEETNYFNNTDEVQVKINIIKELSKSINLHFIHNQRLYDIIYNNRRQGYTEEELDQYIEIITDLVNYNEIKSKLLNEIGTKYENEVEVI